MRGLASATQELPNNKAELQREVERSQAAQEDMCLVKEAATRQWKRSRLSSRTCGMKLARR